MVEAVIKKERDCHGDQSINLNIASNLCTVIQVANQRANKVLLNIRIHIPLKFHTFVCVSRMQSEFGIGGGT